jgi:NAD(P)-dependent dehydrogenase (short-subunit alcohol dehydrogenase family)
MTKERVSAPVVVVTGGSAGVGRATALKFAQERWRVCVIGRSAEGVESVQREIESGNGEAIAFPADVSDASALNGAADEVVGRWGAIDVWINNAMVTMFAPISEMSPEEFRRITEVTYLGYVYGTMAALKHMRLRNCGTIIQIGSALSYRAIPLQSAYCGAKFAVRGFTDSLRSELLHDKSKVRVTMAQLPAVNTPQFDWARNRFPTRPQPLPPIFQPEAIAGHIYALAKRPPRELWVGLSSLKAIAGSMVLPGWLDRYLARVAYDAQFTAEPVPQTSIDDLFEPASFGHVVRGRFSRQARRRVLPVNPAMLRGAVAVGVSMLVGVSLWLAVECGWRR